MNLKSELERIENLLIEIGNSIEEVRLLKTIPHIGDLTASILYSEIGNIKRFNSWTKLYAYFGLDPKNLQSGKMEIRGKISKAGISYIRGLLYSIAISSVNKNGYFREYFEKRKEEGKPPKVIIFAIIQKIRKPPKVIIFAIIQKIIRRIFYVLKYNQPYVKNMYPMEKG